MSKLIIPVSSSDHVQGNENARITLVEYGDYECPFCGEASLVVKLIQKHFGKRLRFVYRNFPLVEIHPHAGIAAITAEFAGSYNKFWEMHDILYENQKNLEMPDLLGYTESLGLSGKDLTNAIEQGIFDEKIKSDFMGGVRSGVNGTPSFFINGLRYNGAYDYETLLDALNSVEQ